MENETNNNIQVTKRRSDVPVAVLLDNVIFPGVYTHIEIEDGSSARAVRKAAGTDGIVLFLMKKQAAGKKEEDKEGSLAAVGTIAKVKIARSTASNRIIAVADGIERARVLILKKDGDILTADTESIPDIDDTHLEQAEESAMCKALKDMWSSFISQTPAAHSQTAAASNENGSLKSLMQEVAASLPLTAEDKQKLLETASVRERFNLTAALLQREIEVQRIRAEVGRKVREQIDKNQREYILREELKVIQKELGDVPQSEAEGYLKKVDELTAADEVKERLRKEISRFCSLAPSSPEASVSRTYIETLLEMPWDKMCKENPDLKHAREVLDEDHYGLEKVKTRIIEYLAVRTLTKKGDSPILCLAGPPGTGKTSIARSVARALGRPYVRVSLGGVRDEAEIRGHRRTYIGAMPGRIAGALRQAGVKNPLILLDEIDKVSADYRGDTASALLEVLDSDQNSHFRDHYIELPVDLSQVLFIATANDLNTMAQPLRDRCEIIEISSYTENEKMHISREYLIPKEIEHNGLTGQQLKISQKALEEIIEGYTREAGVRQLERKISQICRRAARQIIEDNVDKVSVKSSNLEEYLDRKPFLKEAQKHENQIGISHGLAWTAYGGVTLEIEVNVMPGQGTFVLTGQMGDVMKESAQTGISYIRSVAASYGINPGFFMKNDIHIHIPEGAVPKDGPSAGITMASAILSAITGRPLRGNAAMTGEITLRGRVLPVGGLKEKLLAAKKGGFTTVIVPKDNRPEVEELSEEITGKLSILYLDSMDKVLSAVLMKGEGIKAAGKEGGKIRREIETAAETDAGNAGENNRSKV